MDKSEVRMSATCCPTKQLNCDKDFNRCRLMRLAQVRQQSRNIAENIRTKVRNEKTKQLSQMEQKNKSDLKVWQAKKLLEAESQYEKALINFGLGHKQAKSEEDEQVFIQQKEFYDKIAKERGDKAMKKLQVDLNEKNTRKTLPNERRKTSREIEDVRASFVSNIAKMKKLCPENVCVCCPCNKTDTERRNGSLESVNSSENSDLDVEDRTNTHRIQKNESSNSDEGFIYTDNRISDRIRQRNVIFPRLKGFEDNSEDSEDFMCDCNMKYKANVCCTRKNDNFQNTTTENDRICEKYKAKIYHNRKDVTENDENDKTNENRENGRINEKFNENISYTRKGVTDNTDNEENDKTDENYKTRVIHNGKSVIENEKNTSKNVKNKEKVAAIPKVTLRQQNQIHRTSKNVPKNSERIPENEGEIDEIYKRLPTDKSSFINENIPKLNIKSKVKNQKPKLTIRPKYDSTKSKPDSKVPYYDDTKRNFKQYTTQPEIERITSNDLLISPTAEEENERNFYEKMLERDKEAKVRGRQAMEKEKTQRNYREMLKKLPQLQKQERIYDITRKDKPEYHMSEERLKDLHNKKQLQLDSAYEELFTNVRPKIITVPKRYETVEKYEWRVQKEDSTLNLMRSSLTEDQTGTNDKEIVSSDQYNTKEKLTNNSDEIKTDWEISDSNKEKMSSDDYVLDEHLEINTKSSGLEKQSKMNAKRSVSEKQSKVNVKRSVGNITKNSSSNDNSELELSENKKIVMNNKRKQLIELLDNLKKQKNDLLNEVELKNEKLGIKTKTRPITYQIPAKTKKSKQKILVLQNSSTQTSQLEDKSELIKNNKEKPEMCGIKHVPCDCRTNGKSIEKEEVCKILININENNRPEVVVNPLKDVKSTKNLQRPKTRPKDLKTSWRDRFSQNSTVTTSYLSPPDQDSEQTIYESSNLTKINVSSKVLQSNVSDSGTLMFVKKLLKKSHASIESLTVSSATDITTPSQSIIEMDTNCPNLQWKDIMKYLNNLPKSNATNNLKYNTSNTSTTSSTSNYRANKIDNVQDKFAVIEKTYSEKICNINAMIEKLREEKKKMLSPTNYSNNDTTAYLDLISGSSSTDEEQRKLNDQLLKIDIDYAEQLKSLSQSPINKTDMDDSDKELRLRFRKLRELYTSEEKSKLEPTETDLIKVSSTELIEDEGENFTSSVCLDLSKFTQGGNHKRPPISKGLSVVKRFNGNISLMPHELSTIAEADSQLSLKEKKLETIFEAAPQNSPIDKSSEDKSDLDLTESMLHDIGMEWAIPILKKTKQALALSSTSSSSLDSSLARNVGTSGENLKFSSSSIKSDGDPKSLLANLQDISAIQFTSTPVDLMQDSRTHGNVSDLSSVREES